MGRTQRSLWKADTRTIGVRKGLKNLINFRNWAAGMHEPWFSIIDVTTDSLHSLASLTLPLPDLFFIGLITNFWLRNLAGPPHLPQLGCEGGRREYSGGDVRVAVS